MARPIVVSRKDWGARAPRSRTPNPLSRNSIFFLHWTTDENAESIRTVAAQKERMRGIQNFHMDDPKRRYSDIGYSYVVFQPYGPTIKRARIYVGRGFKAVPAAQYENNTGNVAVAVVMGPGDPLKDDTIRVLRWLYGGFPGRTVRGHRQVFATECPGPKLMRVRERVAAASKRSTTLR